MTDERSVELQIAMLLQRKWILREEILKIDKEVLDLRRQKHLIKAGDIIEVRLWKPHDSSLPALGGQATWERRARVHLVHFNDDGYVNAYEAFPRLKSGKYSEHTRHYHANQVRKAAEQ